MQCLCKKQGEATSSQKEETAGSIKPEALYDQGQDYDEHYVGSSVEINSPKVPASRKQCQCKKEREAMSRGFSQEWGSPGSYQKWKTAGSSKTKALYQEEADYQEHYVEALVNEFTLEPCLVPISSNPSLPAVQVTTDRCEDRMEIPWLQITLPPPGTLQIKGNKMITRRAPCTCWRTKQDIIEIDPVTKITQAPDNICICTGVGVNLDDRPKLTVDELNIKAFVNATKSEDEFTPSYAIPAHVTSHATPTGAAPSHVTPTDATSSHSPLRATPSFLLLTHSAPLSTTPSKGEEAAELEAAKKNELEEATLATSDTKLEDVNKTTDDTKPVETKPNIPIEAFYTDEVVHNTEYEIASMFGASTSTKEPEPVHIQMPVRPEVYKQTQKRCTCHDEFDEYCKDIKTLPMVYDNPCYAGHEPYMDLLYNLFPDDCDTACGPYTEIPWDELLIPRNIKLKGARRRRKVCSKSGGPDSKPCDRTDPNSRALVRADTYEVMKRDGASDKVDVEISFEQFMKQFDSIPSCNCISMKIDTNSQTKSPTCACFEMGKKKAPKQPKKPPPKPVKPKMGKPSGKKSRREEILAALDSCQADMLPIKSALCDLKAKIKQLRQMPRRRETPETKNVLIGHSMPCLPPCLRSPIPFPIPMPAPPFAPPPPPLYHPLPPDIQFTAPPFADEKGSSHTTTPSILRGSHKYCNKCRKKKPIQKDSNNTSIESDYRTKRRRRPCKRGQVKEKTMHKKCRCGKGIAAKMTNTCRPKCKCSSKPSDQEDQHQAAPVVPKSPADDLQSGRSSVASEGQLIIEECDC